MNVNENNILYEHAIKFDNGYNQVGKNVGPRYYRVFYNVINDVADE